MSECAHCGEPLTGAVHKCKPAAQGSTDASLTPLRDWYKGGEFEFAEPQLAAWFSASLHWIATGERVDRTALARDKLSSCATPIVKFEDEISMDTRLLWSE